MDVISGWQILALQWPFHSAFGWWPSATKPEPVARAGSPSIGALSTSRLTDAVRLGHPARP